MAAHTHELAGKDLDALLLQVWMSGFKSGAASIVANSLPAGIPQELRRATAAEIATRLTAEAFEDPAAREVARDSIQCTVQCHLHGPGHACSHQATTIRVHKG